MMTRKLIHVIATVAIMVLATNAAVAQSRVTVHGTANMVSGDNDSWALEIGGKLVTRHDYRHFQSTDGVYFAVEDKNGKWGICDNTGTFLLECRFAKTSVNGATATLHEEANGTPKFYDCKTKTHVQAKQVGADFFENEAKARKEKQYRDGTVKRARDLSAAVPPERRFDIRNNDDYTRQQIVYKEKVRLECDQVLGFETNAANDSKTGSSLFFVRNNGLVGAYLIQVYEKNGELVSFAGLTIPYRYFAIHPDGMNGNLKCYTDQVLGSHERFDWLGFEMTGPMDYDNPNSRTGREWICVDKATDKWELQTNNN
jgi:hypothetical protein